MPCADEADMAGGATPQSADSMTSLMQQERRRRRQTDRESLEQIRKRHLEVTNAKSAAVLKCVLGRGTRIVHQRRAIGKRCDEQTSMKPGIWPALFFHL